jgi:hypothetical protein
MKSRLISTVDCLLLIIGIDTLCLEAPRRSFLEKFIIGRCKIILNFFYLLSSTLVLRGTYDFDFKYSGGSSYYSFDIGLAHFINLNVYDTRDDSQLLWLENDLKSVDRAVTPWVRILTKFTFGLHFLYIFVYLDFYQHPCSNL